MTTKTASDGNGFLQLVTNWPVLSVGMSMVVLFLGRDSLESPRIDKESVTLPVVARLQSSDARLWQDPLLPLKDVTCRDRPPLTFDPTNRFSEVPLSYHLTNSELIAVMLDGNSTPSSREARIRMRLAVVSGLLESGFLPDDSFHLGESRLPWPVPWGGDQLSCLPFTYEFFTAQTPHRAREKKTKVCIVYVQEDLLGDHPLHRMALIQTMLARLGGVQPSCNLAMLWIGPVYSSTLKDMLSSDGEGGLRFEKWLELLGLSARF